ncbi:hypothetical protein M1N57_00695 [Dehalococcoidales bacterium]|nr:hypothetical protein [Dehalococcoidales bacterium]MCL0091379.1 hypothetical protein [Dehalococcoidales bacterium]
MEIADFQRDRVERDEVPELLRRVVVCLDPEMVDTKVSKLEAIKLTLPPLKGVGF